MTTFADMLRSARQANDNGPLRGMSMMTTGGDGVEPVPAALSLPDLEARIYSTAGPVVPDNPRARCDFCPRVTSADMLVLVGERFACDGCWTAWNRHGERWGTPRRSTEGGAGG
jgi:hypothetical protein